MGIRGDAPNILIQYLVSRFLGKISLAPYPAGKLKPLIVYSYCHGTWSCSANPSPVRDCVPAAWVRAPLLSLRDRPGLLQPALDPSVAAGAASRFLTKKGRLTFLFSGCLGKPVDLEGAIGFILP